MGNTNQGNVGEDLALVAAWLTVMADFMAAIGATVLVEPPPTEPTADSNEDMQQQISVLQNQLQLQKKQIQKQQIQFQLWQMQLELKELEQQLNEKNVRSL